MRWILYFLTIAAGAQDFSSEVRPILQKPCLGCHSDAVRNSGLSLQTGESLRTEGNRGPGGEHILAAIQYAGPLEMPPTGKLQPANKPSWIAGCVPASRA